MDITRALNTSNDFFEKAAGQSETLFEKITGQTNRVQSEQGETLFEKLTQGTAEREKRENDFKNRFGINASPAAVRGLMDAYDNGSVDEDGVYSILTAKAISDNFARQGIDLPMNDVLANLDAYTELVTGQRLEKDYTSKSALKSVLDSFGVAWHSTRRSILGLQRMEAERAGRDDELAVIMERLKIADRQIADHSDPEKRNPVVRALQWAAQSSIYTAGIGLATAVNPGLGFMTGTALMSGGVYNDLRDSGVDIKNAESIAIGVGALESVIETQLGVVGGLASRAGGKTLQGAISKKITQTLISQLGAKGVWLQAAVGVGTRYISDALGEGLEEVLQEITEIGGMELAAAIQKEGVTLTDEDRRGYVKRVIDSGVAGFASALVMGFAGVGVDAFNTIADMARVKNLADATPSLEAFKKESKPYFNEKLSDEEIAAQQKIIHEGRQNIREQEEAKIAAEVKELHGLGEGYDSEKEDKETGEPVPLGELYRKQNNRLYTELDEKNGVFKAGDARVESNTNLDAHIKYSRDGDGVITIEEFQVRPDRDSEAYRREFYRDFAENFAGHEVRWNPNTERAVDIREDLIRNNPRGRQAGLNYYAEADAGNMADARYRNQVIDNFKKYFPRLGNAEHAVMAAEWEHFAGQHGLSLEEYVNREFGSLDKAFTTDANQRIDAAAKEGKQIKGAVSFEDMARDAKAVIYVSTNADLSTFIHEMGHIYRRRLQGDMLAQASRIWGIQDGKWTTAQEERFTEDLERWRREGAAPTPEMRTFFQKFAEFLKKIINAVSERAEVSPEIKEFFDQLYAGEETGQQLDNGGQGQAAADSGSGRPDQGDVSPNAQGNAQEAQDGQAQAETGTQAATEAARERYEANKKFNEERPLLDKNNNGKTDIKPRQTGVTTAEELRDKAAKHIEELRSWVNGITEKYDVRIKERPVDENNPLPLKTVEGIQRKLNDGDTIDAILDVMGMTIVVKDLQTLVKITEELQSRDDVVRIKDRYKKVDHFGYRDVLANVKLSDGMIAEVQVNIEQMLAAKSEFGGHKYYEIARVLEKEIKAGTLTIEEAVIDKEFLAKMSNAVYEKAYQAALSESHFNASSLESIWHSDIALLMENREGESVLSSFTLNKLHELGLSANNSLENTSPSMSKNLSDGSSNDGTSTAGMGDAILSAGAAEAGKKESSFISLPSTINISQTENAVNNNFENNQKNNIDDSGVPAIREKYQAAQKEYGDTDTINVNGSEIEGRWVITEAETPAASHDETTFNETEGFIKADGKTINDRDYKRDKAAQEAVLEIASNYDSRALDGVVITTDGIVISGNNRTMSGKLAAKQGTDGKYLAALEKKAKRYGFTDGQVKSFSHPRLLFEVDSGGKYDTALFAQFNRSTKKALDPVETAVKMSKLVKDSTIKTVAGAISEHETVNDLYKDKKALLDFFNTLKTDGLIGEYDMPQFFTEADGITAAGEELLENVLLGSTLSEANIRTLKDGRALRQKLVRALPQLVDSRAMGEYSVIPEVNKAVRIAAEVERNSKTFKSVEEWAAQQGFSFMEQRNQVAIELAKQLEGKGQSGFADFMGGLNAVLAAASQGQGDMFSGGVESKEEIVRRYLGVKAENAEIREANNKVIADKAAPTLDKVDAALRNAGLARGEADGAMFQAEYQERMTLADYLAKQGLSSPISDYMLDKMRIPHGNTLKQQKKLEIEASKAADEYQEKRANAIAEYRKKIESGEIVNKSLIEQMIEAANGHPDLESTQAARRRCAKKGIRWEAGLPSVETTQTLFQLDDELVEGAARHDTWQEFRDSVQTGETTDADNAWYKSLWGDARKIYNTLFQEGEEKTNRAQVLDNSFIKEADREYLTEALKTIHGILNDQSLEPAEGENRIEYDNTRRLQERIRRELPGAGSVIGFAAQVNSGKILSSSQYDRLKKFIRDNPREYRSVFGDVMGQKEYLEDLAEAADGEPHARLADPRAVKTDTMERLREIGKEIGDPALQRQIESGEITMDDPQIAAYEKGQESEYRKAADAVKALEDEIGQDFARLANETKRRMVRLYEDMLAAREKLSGEKDRLARMVESGLKIADSYRRKERLEQASYEQALKAFDDYAKAFGIDADVRESLARRDARAEERAKQQGLNKKRRALAALREVKRKLVKRITRNVSFETIGYDQAVVVKTVQRIFEPSIIEGVNKWIGGARGPLLREVWSQWSTDEQYREKLINAAADAKGPKIADILDKPWDFITTADKRALIRLLPKADYVRDLGLEELIRENEESVQLDIEEKVVDGQVHFILGEKLERTIKEAVGEDLYNRIQNKPLAEWTLAEAEELARTVDRHTVEGRKELRAKKEARRILEQRYRGQVLDAVRKTGIAIDDGDTPEEKERKQKEIDRILGKYARGDKRNNLFNSFFDANLRRFTTAMDGGRKGIFTSLLYWGENDAYNKKETRIAARRAAVEAAMEKNNITLDELYREVKIPGLEGTDLYRVSGGMITVDDLLYIMRGYNNEETRRAITYGNLTNARERAEFQRRRGNIEDIQAFANLGEGRLAAVMNFANNFFSKEENKKFLKLAEVIGADYDRNGERLNQAMIDIFNKPMWRVENYVPMNRQEQSGGTNENRVIEDLLGMIGAGQKALEKGFTEKRIQISPEHQAPIELGLYKTWVQSVSNTEHLMAYAPLVRTLNAVFKGYDTGEVRQAVDDRWGRDATKRIDDTIAEFASPNAGKFNTGPFNSFIRNLRGKTATAYLAWKASGVLKQAVTSPWPYLQEIPPHEYLRAALEVAGGAGKVNEFIKEKSAYMKNRDFDPMMKLVREQLEKIKNPVSHKVDQFNSLGMKGLEWIDWAAVAPGWLAKYRMELAAIAKEQEAEYQNLLKKYHGAEWADILPTEESKANRASSEIMSDGQQDYEAVARADDAVRRMQPSSRATDLAPIFKNRNEAANAILQFQAALNVIWQNIRYDLPLAVKEKQVMTAVGMVTGYAMAGIGLGVLLDDDDDDEKQERSTALWILYNSMTQFTDAVPVIGEMVTTTAESAITGKRTYRGQQNLWPVIDKAFGGVTNAAGMFREDDPEKRKQKFSKAAGNFCEAVGIWYGLPVSGAKELGKAAGIGDGDGETDFYPEAFLGRRKK